jgi:hypothetical protein
VQASSDFSTLLGTSAIIIEGYQCLYYPRTHDVEEEQFTFMKEYISIQEIEVANEEIRILRMISIQSVATRKMINLTKLIDSE